MSGYGGSDDIDILNTRIQDLLECHFKPQPVHHDEILKTPLVKISAASLFSWIDGKESNINTSERKIRDYCRKYLLKDI